MVDTSIELCHCTLNLDAETIDQRWMLHVRYPDLGSLFDPFLDPFLVDQKGLNLIEMGSKTGSQNGVQNDPILGSPAIWARWSK